MIAPAKRRCPTCSQVIRRGVPRPPTRPQQCGECDQVGHNARTCSHAREPARKPSR